MCHRYWSHTRILRISRILDLTIRPYQLGFQQISLLVVEHIHCRWPRVIDYCNPDMHTVILSPHIRACSPYQKHLTSVLSCLTLKCTGTTLALLSLVSCGGSAPLCCLFCIQTKHWSLSQTRDWAMTNCTDFYRCLFAVMVFAKVFIQVSSVVLHSQYCW